MDELVDELSGTTLDGDANNKDIPMKSKNNKPVNRTASIINRSKLLMLSDSETDDEDVLDKKRFTKHLRISKQKNNNWKSKSYLLCKGKRKRNSASEMAICPSSLFAAGTSGINDANQTNRTKGDSMECDHYDSSSSELTDESPTECNFDGDDEQSDFYDSSANPTPRCRNRNYCHSRPKLEFKKPANPFFSVDLEPHHSPSINLWKRRRPLH